MLVQSKRMRSPLDANSTAREMVLQGFVCSHDHVSSPIERETYKFFPSVRVAVEKEKNGEMFSDYKLLILYITANDPETANDPQKGPQMILDRK